VIGGLSLLGLGKLNDAKDNFDKAIKLDPNNADAWCNKADSLDELQEFKESLKCYNTPIKMILSTSKHYAIKDRFFINLDFYLRL
jgi:tetratricopeptide (TPR) repeat protein